ncbi:MAG: hypothetical protein J1F11_08235 [Oscillospiraceae bacterium]|nr:hypothetical protein [Oscillospiraceae bacterium]
MKYLKCIAIGIVSLPFILIGLIIVFNIFGMCVNHISTNMQTRKLEQHLTDTISDIKILDSYSETGNTSGTGNHVDSLSVVTFSSGKSLDEIRNCMAKYYEFNEWYCHITETDTGFKFYLCTSAPFSDNIEGH